MTGCPSLVLALIFLVACGGPTAPTPDAVPYVRSFILRVFGALRRGKASSINRLCIMSDSALLDAGFPHPIHLPSYESIQAT